MPRAHPPRFPDPNVPPPGTTPVSFGTGLVVASSVVTPDFGTGHSQVARGDAAGGGAALSDATPTTPGTAAAGTGTAASRDDHRHAPPSAVQVGALEASMLATDGDMIYRAGGLPTPLTTSAAGRELLTTATHAAQRDALAAHVSMGTSYDAACSTTAYLDVAGTPSAAPLFGPGESLVYACVPVSTPGGMQIVASHTDTTGGAVRGWQLRCGDNGSARAEFGIYLAGLNGSAPFQLPGADFAGALGVPHVLAIAITALGAVHYAWDGVLQTPIAALSGTYVPPDAGDALCIGVLSSSPLSVPAGSPQPVHLRAYSTVLSDADLVAVAATRTAYQLATPGAGTCTADVHVRQWWGTCSPLATAIDRADTSRRWRVVGPLVLHEHV